MEATRRLIEESQGQAVRLKDIAQASGVSRQAIYLHFGSRVGLMVATVQYIDETAGFVERTQPVRDEADSARAVELFVDFWASYVPTIYGLAKQLLVLRETDEGAAAAWKDRMDGLRNVPCRYLIERLEKDGRLAPGWGVEMAIDFFWALISVQTWESLVIERGWSGDQYAMTLKQVIERALIAVDPEKLKQPLKGQPLDSA
jgi:AcrR family transcriptional regulator